MSSNQSANETHAKALLELASIRNSAFVETLKKQRNKEADEAASLAAEVAALRHSLAKANEALDAEKTKSDVANNGSKLLNEKLVEIRTQLSQVTAERNALQIRIDELTEASTAPRKGKRTAKAKAESK